MARKLVLVGAMLIAALALLAWQFAAAIGGPADREMAVWQDSAGESEPAVTEQEEPAAGTPDEAVPEDEAMEGEGIAARAQRAWRGAVSFEATANIRAVTATDTFTAEAYLWYRQPNSFRLQAISPIRGLDGAGTTAVFDGETLWTYLPDGEQVTAVEGVPRVLFAAQTPAPLLFPALQLVQLPQFMANLAGRDDLHVAEEDVVDGRPAIRIEVGPSVDDEDAVAHVLWIDEETALPRRVQFNKAGGGTFFQLDFTEIHADVDLSPDLFTLETPSGATEQRPNLGQLATQLGWREVSLRQASAQAGFPLLAPAALPEATEQTDVRFVSLAGQPMVAIFYAHEGAGETVLLQTDADAQSLDLPGGEVAAIAGGRAEVYAIGDATAIAWRQDETRLVLVSTLPREQALELAGTMGQP